MSKIHPDRYPAREIRTKFKGHDIKLSCFDDEPGVWLEVDQLTQTFHPCEREYDLARCVAELLEELEGRV